MIIKMNKGNQQPCFPRKANRSRLRTYLVKTHYIVLITVMLLLFLLVKDYCKSGHVFFREWSICKFQLFGYFVKKIFCINDIYFRELGMGPS